MDTLHLLKKYRSKVVVLALLFCAGSTLIAQSYRFSRYTADDGLPQQYVYSINQDDAGFIWVGTGEGLARFDGMEFRNFNLQSGLAENFVTATIIDNKGALWVGHNKGSISKIVGGKPTVVISDTSVRSSITSICADSTGNVWAVSQGGKLIRIEADGKVKVFPIADGQRLFYAVATTPKGNLLIGTGEGAFILDLDEKKNPDGLFRVKQSGDGKISCITRSKLNPYDYWLGTNGEGMYQLRFEKDGSYKARHSQGSFNLEDASIQDIFEDKEHNLWVSTFTGLYKLHYEEANLGHETVTIYNETNGLCEFVRTVFQDREGNIWIGTYGEGLAMLKDEFFSLYVPGGDLASKDVRSFWLNGTVKWFGVGNGLLRYDASLEESWKFYSTNEGLPIDAVTALQFSGDNLWIGTEQSGLYKLDVSWDEIVRIPYAEDKLSNSVNDILIDGTRIYLATKGGVHKITEQGQKLDKYSTITGLIHNNIYDIHKTRAGRLFVSSHGNLLTELTEGTIGYLQVSKDSRLMDIKAIGEDDQNRLWVATLGNGVFFESDSGFVSITTNNGLISDYCYSLVLGADNDIWVGHRGGLSRINTETLLVEVFGKKHGITADFSDNAAFRDNTNRLWFGTNEGTISFDPAKYRKNDIPPAINLKNIYLSDEQLELTDKIELPYGAYKLELEYIGISFIQQENIRYQYFLEGYDLDWSTPTNQNVAMYPRIEEGTYTFHVKACNSDGVCSEEAIVLAIEIDNPYWKKWWFYGLIGALLFGGVALFIKIREKNQKQVQKYLENQLELRQAEVLESNIALEEKNKNITASINYALRIQQAILPNKSMLTDQFPESFIFYQPRDIVSGDFYWFSHVKDRFLVACADCTGHGVPGGFMSMISATIFKEVASQLEVNDPALFLEKVNETLIASLHQDSSKGSYDGLDLVMCSFDPKTRIVEFAGAMRPLIVIRGGNPEIIRTDRHSIGGYEGAEKKFKKYTIELQKGDSLYMFSDGFQDQFGGPRNRKFQLKKLVGLLGWIQDKTMSEQHEIVRSEFDKWRGDCDQVDDVLLMAIRIP